MNIKRYLLSILALLVLFPAFGNAQSLKAAWEIAGPPAESGKPRPTFTSAMAMAYTYRLYPEAATIGRELSGVSCTTTNDPFQKTCSAPVPDDLGLTVGSTP